MFLGVIAVLGLTVSAALRQRRAAEAALRASHDTLEYGLSIDGAARKFEARVVPLGTDRALSICRDITELQEAQRALRESEDRFRSFFDASPIGKSITGLDGRYLRVNPALCDMLGYTEEAVLRIGVADIHPPEAIKKILDCLGLPSRAPPIAPPLPEDADEPEFSEQAAASRRAGRERCTQIPRQ